MTVTVTYRIGSVANGTIDTLKLMGRSVGNPAKTSTGVLVVTVIRPVISIAKGVNPGGTPSAGHQSHVHVDGDEHRRRERRERSRRRFDSDVGAVQARERVGDTADGVSATIEYSNDGGTTWTYVPVSTGCSAAIGFDRCVNRIRWRLRRLCRASRPIIKGR